MGQLVDEIITMIALGDSRHREEQGRMDIKARPGDAAVTARTAHEVPGARRTEGSRFPS